jgi:hypothetical protein
MSQGGVAAQYNIITCQMCEVIFHIERPTESPGAMGSGVVLTVHFVPNTNVRTGSSALQWTHASVFGDTMHDEILQRTYGGTVTLQ